jgi:hypothetical protein
MSDQCKHCVKRGKYEECIKNECDQMETWIIQHLLLLVDIEHRRRVAAEAVIEKCKHCVWHNHTGLCPDKCEPYIKWQSIIKEG